MKRRIAWVAGVTLAAALGGVQAAPHEHGVGTLQVAVDGQTLAIELRLPAKDIVGFERAPRTDAERKRLEQAGAVLADEGLFTPAPEARCTVTGKPVVELPAFSAKDTAGDDHADFSAAFRYVCANAAALATLEHGVFKAFPKVKRLKAQTVSPRGQRQAVLTHGKPRLSF